MNRVVVFGSRTWLDHGMIGQRLLALPADWIIVHGGCYTGANASARFLGRAVEVYPADWLAYGPSAGPRRNAVMAALPGVVLGIGFRTPGVSKGTDDMRRQLEARGVPIELYS